MSLQHRFVYLSSHESYRPSSCSPKISPSSFHWISLLSTPPAHYAYMTVEITLASRSFPSCFFTRFKMCQTCTKNSYMKYTSPWACFSVSIFTIESKKMMIFKIFTCASYVWASVLVKCFCLFENCSATNSSPRWHVRPDSGTLDQAKCIRLVDDRVLLSCKNKIVRTRRAQHALSRAEQELIWLYECTKASRDDLFTSNPRGEVQSLFLAVRTSTRVKVKVANDIDYGQIKEQCFVKGKDRLDFTERVVSKYLS